MSFNPNNFRHLVVALGIGALGGAAILQSHHDEKAKSQAERDDPEGCSEVCAVVSEILNEWTPQEYEREDDYTDDLVDYLRNALREHQVEHGGARIRVKKRVRTDLGTPDILIDDRLVLELKVGPPEGEKDRLIGQCCKYSVRWVTWAVVIDMDNEKEEKLVELLNKKSLHYIEVISFSDAEDDEEDEDDEYEC